MMLLLIGVVLTGATQDTLAFSLDKAVARGLAVSPTVAAADGAVAGPRGSRAEAFWPFPENPVLEYGRIQRAGGPVTTLDWQWALTQEVEIAGQWLVRRGAAGALVTAAEIGVVDARRTVAREVRRAYATLVLAERRAALTDSAAAFAERLAALSRRLFASGETNRLELNATILEGARGRSAADRSRAEADAAGADLGRLLGLPRDTLPAAEALPPIPFLTWQSDSILAAFARTRRPDLQAAAARLESAHRSVSLSRLAVVPNLTVSAVGAREGVSDQLLGFAVGVRVPLFRRQQAGRGAAAAELAVAQATVTATERAVTAEVVSAATRFRHARAAERRFATEVLTAATENVALTEQALAEGEVGVTDVLVLRASAVAAQLEYLEVLQDAAEAWFELAAALGVEPSQLPSLLAVEN